MKSLIAIPQQLPKMTVEEYLEWELHQDIRYEYVNGEVFAMTGGTIPHKARTSAIALTNLQSRTAQPQITLNSVAHQPD